MFFPACESASRPPHSSGPSLASNAASSASGSGPRRRSVTLKSGFTLNRASALLSSSRCCPVAHTNDSTPRVVARTRMTGPIFRASGRVPMMDKTRMRIESKECRHGPRVRRLWRRRGCRAHRQRPPAGRSPDDLLSRKSTHLKCVGPPDGGGEVHVNRFSTAHGFLK